MVEEPPCRDDSEQPNAAGWHRRDVTVTLDATDEAGVSGVEEISYTIDGGDPRTIADGGSFTVSTEGTTTVRYHATDNANNAEADKTLTIKLDKTAPAVVEVSPREGAKKVSKKSNVTATFSEKVTNVEGATFELFKQQGRKA